MTQDSTSVIVGRAAEPTRINWRDIRTPEQFAEAARLIVRSYQGHEAHRQMDRLTNELLCNLGYGEGAELFTRAVLDWHHPQLQYPLPSKPRWRCRFGFHKWAFDRESDIPWVSPELCIYCGARSSASLHEICP